MTLSPRRGNCRVPDEVTVVIKSGLPDTRQAAEEIAQRCHVSLISDLPAFGLRAKGTTEGVVCILMEPRVRFVEVEGIVWSNDPYDDSTS